MLYQLRHPLAALTDFLQHAVSDCRLSPILVSVLIEALCPILDDAVYR